MYALDEKLLDQFIVDALHEDIMDGDHTSLSTIPKNDRTKARLLVKDEGVLAGVEIAKRVFKHVDPTASIEVHIEDGKNISYGDVAFIVECNSQALLSAERLVLNTMQRLSGVASLSARYAKEVEDLDVTILDTRKTTPLLRFLEKWAVAVGGCSNYRTGLYDWIMIKDNHVDACGNHTLAIQKANDYLKEHNKDLNITVEVRNHQELDEVLKAGHVTRIMLDNFELSDLKSAVDKIKDDGRFESEASGGVNLSTLRSIAETGVNFISVGALTHSAGSLDLSLKVIKE